MTNTDTDTDTQAITEEVMLVLADSMASAASSFTAHGYDTFILARDIFKSTNHQLFKMMASRNSRGCNSAG